MKKVLGIVCAAMLVLGVVACKKKPDETQPPAVEAPSDQTPSAPMTTPDSTTTPGEPSTGSDTMTPNDSTTVPSPDDVDQGEPKNNGIVPPGTPNSGY